MACHPELGQGWGGGVTSGMQEGPLWGWGPAGHGGGVGGGLRQHQATPMHPPTSVASVEEEVLRTPEPEQAWEGRGTRGGLKLGLPSCFLPIPALLPPRSPSRPGGASSL